MYLFNKFAFFLLLLSTLTTVILLFLAPQQVRLVSLGGLGLLLSTLFLLVFISTSSHLFDIRDVKSDLNKGVLTLFLIIGISCLFLPELLTTTIYVIQPDIVV